MANEFHTLEQIEAINGFMKKNTNINFRISHKSENGEGILCIPIGNKSQLGTLLSKIEQTQPHSIPDLFKIIEKVDLTSVKYLILRVIKNNRK